MIVFFEKMYKLLKFITNSDYRFLVLSRRGFLENFSSEKFVKRQYRISTGQTLNLDNPVLYTEKLQWLKLYDHREEYTCMVDKFAVKKYVAEKIGEKYVVPLIGVWDSPDEIDFESLPQKFVLKTTHDSGGFIHCTDKATLDIQKAIKKINSFFRRDYYACSREWMYKHVPHRIIAEPFLEDSKYKELRDYKFFTFGGEPKIMYIAQGRGSSGETYADFFDMEFNHLPITIDHEMAPAVPEKPNNFELMKQLAAKLSAGTPQLRVDFYEVDGRVYFGEMTFFHCSGMDLVKPEEWNKILGDWVKLPPKSGEV